MVIIDHQLFSLPFHKITELNQLKNVLIIMDFWLINLTNTNEFIIERTKLKELLKKSLINATED